MKFTDVCFITNDVLRLRAFYEAVFGIQSEGDEIHSGIGKELVTKCKDYFPGSEWLVGCDKKNNGFYKKLGFQDTLETGNFLVIPCKLF